MTQLPAATIWIVDDDLGFVWWLGEVFTEAGCRTLPALGCEQAIDLMKRLHVGIDVLIVNPQLPGVAGMFEVFSRMKPSLKVITIGRTPRDIIDVIRPQASLERPTGSEPISRSEWLKKARKLLKELATAAAV